MNTRSIPEKLTQHFGRFAAEYPTVSTIIRAVISVWPEHESYIVKRFIYDSTDFLRHSEELAINILKIMQSDIEEFCADYKWMCEEFLKEELYFRRNKEYRLSTIKDACEEVYDNPEFMKRYMYGLLVSQVLWRNHAAVFQFFRSEYLPSFKAPFDHLEVGPGHGLFLAQVAGHPFCCSAHGWDISSESIRITKNGLDALGLTSQVNLLLCDVTLAEKTDSQFDSITVSEVLEHVEKPQAVLKGLFDLLRPGGRIFINVPVNSPAPDHIYLWRHPEEVNHLVEAIGFKILCSHFAPLTGFSLQEARDKALTISTVIIAQKPL